MDRKVLSPEDWGAKCGELVAVGKRALEVCTDLIIDAILHYHVPENGMDASRPYKVYTILEDAGLSKHLNAYRRVLGQATAISGVGKTDPWKGKGAMSRLDKGVSWQTVVEQLENQGLFSFLTTPAPVQSKKGPGSIKLQPGITDETKNAATVMLDKLAEMDAVEQLEAVQAFNQVAGSGGGLISDPGVQAAFAAAEIRVAKLVNTAEVLTPDGPKTGIEQAYRAIETINTKLDRLFVNYKAEQKAA